MAHDARRAFFLAARESKERENAMTTREVARALQIRPGALLRGVWEGRLPAPAKDGSGTFTWSEDDFRRACWTFHRKDLDAFLKEAGHDRLDG